tara:strand:+ start:1194 stop:1427 length:234 start_codon:yes stop_codon:yes gene_type:complete
MACDILKEGFINSRQWMVQLIGDESRFDLHQICIQTGCLTFDVCGKSQGGHIGDVSKFIDWDGNEFEIDDFYIEYSK